MPRSDQFDHGYVVGILVTSRIDGPDEDRKPDAVGATSVRPEFKRAKGQYRLPLHTPESGAHGMFVSSESIRCAVMPSGHITSDVDTTGAAKADAQPGVWLPVGTYAVSFGGHFPGFDIEVTTAHTMEAPLDLWSWAPTTPTPGTPVTVLEVPGGAAEGDALGWGVDGLTWLAPGTVDPAVIEAAVQDYLTANPPEGGGGEPGPPGEDGRDGVDGASAYEIAVAEGFVGTETEWLASLVGPQGEPGQDGQDGAPGADGADGRSAYEVARDHGYGGTETQWLASLKGEKGDKGDPGQDGAPGEKGDKGEPGEKGDPGDPGPALVAHVPVTTGTEPRPDVPFVIWVGGTTQPTAMGVGDIWYQEQQ